MMSELIKRLTKTINQTKIQELYPLVNGPRDLHINVNSYQLVDKIIELWLEEQGYDFWDNPYPEIIEWTVTKEKEIIVTYIPS